MVNVKQTIVVVAAAFFVFPVLQCEAQKFKLPNLLPFKKQPKAVSPFQLSDQAAGNSRFDFLKSRVKMPTLRPPARPGPLSALNDRSKEFFARAGSDLSRFAENTKQALVDGWKPPRAHTAWWNREPEEGSATPLFNWRSQSARPEADPLVPRVAREYQNRQPRHRF